MTPSPSFHEWLSVGCLCKPNKGMQYPFNKQAAHMTSIAVNPYRYENELNAQCIQRPESKPSY